MKCRITDVTNRQTHRQTHTQADHAILRVQQYGAIATYRCDAT